MQRKAFQSLGTIQEGRKFYDSLPDIIEGRYLRARNQLFKEGIKLLLATRKSTTPDKPKDFLLAIDNEKRRHYVSSLFPRGKDVYELEFRNSRYLIVLEDLQATITSLKVEAL